MMVANLVGFSFGISGLEIMAEEMFTFYGLVLLFKAFVTFTVATFFMFAARRDEERSGKALKGF
jgi:hypothetical protein